MNPGGVDHAARGVNVDGSVVCPRVPDRRRIKSGRGKEWKTARGKEWKTARGGHSRTGLCRTQKLPINAAISIVATRQNVSDTAYGNTMC